MAILAGGFKCSFILIERPFRYENEYLFSFAFCFRPLQAIVKCKDVLFHMLLEMQHIR